VELHVAADPVVPNLMNEEGTPRGGRQFLDSHSPRFPYQVTPEDVLHAEVLSYHGKNVQREHKQIRLHVVGASRRNLIERCSHGLG
jgi:hypothetical protein